MEEFASATMHSVHAHPNVIALFWAEFPRSVETLN